MNTDYLNKKCNKCGEIKPLNEFYKQKGYHQNINPQCKKCIIKRTEEFRRKNPLKYIEYSKRWAKNNPEKANNITKKYRKNNPDKAKKFYRNARIKRESTIKGKLNNRISIYVRISLKGNKCGRSV